jgi:hypothetical protein
VDESVPDKAVKWSQAVTLARCLTKIARLGGYRSDSRTQAQQRRGNGLGCPSSVNYFLPTYAGMLVVAPQSAPFTALAPR